MKILVLLVIILLSGCSSSHLLSTPTQLTLVHNEVNFSKELGTIKNTNRILSPIHLTIEIKEDPKTKNLYAFEKASVNGGYVFDYSEALLVHKIFKPASSAQLLRLGNLTLFYLQAKNKSFYLLVNHNSKKTLEFLYPLSYEQIANLVKALDANKLDKIPKKESFHATSPKDLPLSSWSPSTIIIETIVKKQGGRALRR